MKILITLTRTNTGRIQLSYVRSTNERGGIGTGASLPPFNPNAMAEIEAILSNLGVDDNAIRDSVSRVRQSGPGELVKVADLDVAENVLTENGFAM